MKPIPYGKHFITEEDITAVTETLLSNNLTQGPKVLEFETAFAEYIDCKYAVAVSSGTAALHLAAMALGINGQSNVITTPITFSATANCIRYCGGNVWFADIDRDTLLMDINKVEVLIRSKPKGFFSGLVAVDFAGYPHDMEVFKKLADDYGLWIIEDACHAPGGFFVDSKRKVHNCGDSSFADIAVFSFHPVKHIACGEGGMITCNNEAMYQRILRLRSHGITKDQTLLNENHGEWYYEMQELGYNYRLTDFQAALGISQLRRADGGLRRRREIAGKYFRAFKDIKEIISQSGIVEGHAYHLYIIQVERRKELYEYLRQKGIICQIHYIPVYRQPYYQSLCDKVLYMEAAENYYQHCLSLPIFPTLAEDEQEFVIASILIFLETNR